jgi:uncharacterized membrane protein YuzA (DUF378 family)
VSALDDLDVKMLAWIGSAGGSIAYGLANLTQFDLLAELLSGNVELGAIAFLVAGAVALANNLGVVELD